MEPLSFWEKLQVLFSNMLAHPLFILLLLVPVAFIAFNKKITKKFIIAFYLLVIAIVLFIGNTTLFELFDNMMDNIFMTLYFPNFVTLFIVEVASAVITLITFLRPKIHKVNKIINVVAFAIIQTLFCLVLTVIQVNNIDIYKENALYGSNDVLTLMQLLMGAFALQLITIIIIHVIEKITARLDSRESETRQTSINSQLEKLKETKIVEDNKVDINKPTTKENIITIVKEKPVKPFKDEPVKPLDHSLINENKIKPIDLKKEIDKEKTVKPIKVEPAKPLNHSLIDELKIEPIDLNSEIDKEKALASSINPDEIISAPTLEVPKTQNIKPLIEKPIKKPDLLKPMESFKKEIQEQPEVIKTLSPATKIPIVKEPIVDKPVKKQSIVEPVSEKTVPEVSTSESKLINFKPEFPDNIEVKQPKDDHKKPSIINQIFNNAKPSKKIPVVPTITEPAPLAAGLMMHKPGQEETWIEPPEKPALTLYEVNPMFKPDLVDEQLVEEKDLVTNLDIIDFDKTAKLIKNIKKLYTL